MSAQVIVRSASGKRLRGDVPITSGNIASYMPSREDAEVTTAAFRDAGFQVGQLVGISFSITAPLTRFEELFGVKLVVHKRGAVAMSGSRAPAGGLELPLDRIPRELRERVVSVAFTPPADLHEGNSALLI